MYIDFTFLRYHVLCNYIKISEWFVHKRSDIISSLQYFGINIAVYEIQKLIKNFFNIANFIEISHNQRVLSEELLFLFFETLFKLILDFLLFILKFFLQIEKAFINIFHLLEFKSFELFLNLF